MHSWPVLLGTIVGHVVSPLGVVAMLIIVLVSRLSARLAVAFVGAVAIGVVGYFNEKQQAIELGFSPASSPLPGIAYALCGLVAVALVCAITSHMRRRASGQQ